MSLDLNKLRDYKFITSYRHNKRGDLFYHNTLEELIKFNLERKDKLRIFGTHHTSELLKNVGDLEDFLHSHSTTEKTAFTFNIIVPNQEGYLDLRSTRLLTKYRETSFERVFSKVFNKSGIVIPVMNSRYITEAQREALKSISHIAKFSASLGEDLRKEFLAQNEKYLKSTVEESGLDWDKVKKMELTLDY